MVRLQTDNDAADLPDTMLDPWIREGFDRTLALERFWPFLQHTWTLTLTSPATTIPLPTSPEPTAISRLRDTTASVKLTQLDEDVAEDMFSNQSSTETPDYFSVWGDTITLWPTPSPKNRTYRMRGYRKPTWTGVGTDELDGDPRLHTAIFHYAVALVYAQLEDPELEADYMQRWANHVNVVQRELMKPQHEQPLILNGGIALPARSRVWLGV